MSIATQQPVRLPAPGAAAAITVTVDDLRRYGGQVPASALLVLGWLRAHLGEDETVTIAPSRIAVELGCSNSLVTGGINHWHEIGVLAHRRRSGMPDTVGTYWLVDRRAALR